MSRQLMMASAVWLLMLVQTGCASLNEKIQAGDNSALDGISALDVNQADSAGVTPLMTAARYNPSALPTLLSKGADVNQADNEGWTALIYAAHYNPQSLRTLLDAGANVNAVNQNGWSALGQASRNHPQYVDLLLKAGADPAQASVDGWTPLHNALRYHPEAAASLLQAGAPLNGQNKDGWTPLMLAVRYNPAFTDELLRAGARHDLSTRWGWTALMLGAATLNRHDLQTLIDAGADVNARRPNGATALMVASAYRPDNIPVLLAAGGDVSAAVTEDITMDTDFAGKSGRSIDVRSGATAADIAALFGNQQPAKDLQQALAHQADEQSDWDTASATATLAAYQTYLEQQPYGRHVREAKAEVLRLQQQADKARAAYKKKAARQACRLQEDEWLYRSKACRNGLAEGFGVAVNDIKGLRFEGQFAQGKRLHGRISVGHTLMYEGGLEDGKPHGEGVCMHDGEPEECRYYHGKRIDTLYKVRLETEKQRLALEAQKQEINASLKRNEEAIAQMQSQGDSTTVRHSDPNSLENMAKREVVKRSADLLFDQLF